MWKLVSSLKTLNGLRMLFSIVLLLILSTQSGCQLLRKEKPLPPKVRVVGLMEGEVQVRTNRNGEIYWKISEPGMIYLFEEGCLKGLYEVYR